MDVDTIKTIGGIVENQGFSIVACLALAWYSWRLTSAQIRDLTTRIRKLEDQRAGDATRHASSQERIVRSLSLLVRGRPCMANITSATAVQSCQCSTSPSHQAPLKTPSTGMNMTDSVDAMGGRSRASISQTTWANANTPMAL